MKERGAWMTVKGSMSADSLDESAIKLSVEIPPVERIIVKKIKGGTSERLDKTMEELNALQEQSRLRAGENVRYTRSSDHFDRTIRIYMLRLNDKQKKKLMQLERELMALADEVEERTTTMKTRKGKSTK
jgi:hypothetical protein